MTCPDYKWCKGRLGLDPMKMQHGFRPLCETCSNFDYLEAQQERIGPPPDEIPMPRHILRREFNQLKGELAHIHTEVHSLKAKRGKHRNVV